MSLIKAANVQIGAGPSASNNFHWRNLLDGLLRMSRGNAGSPITDVMRVKADNSVEFPGGVASGVLGAGQTWQNVLGSRWAGVTYTNTTGRPILVQAWGSATYTTTALALTVNEVVAANCGVGIVGSGATVSAVVQSGDTYRVSGINVALLGWAELR